MTFLLIFSLCLLVAASASLSASETALFSLSPMSLKSYRLSSSIRQKLIAHLMDHPRDVLVTILILNVLANLLIQNVVSGLFDQFPDWTLKVGVPLVITLVFGEVLPKSLAMANNAKVAAAAAPPVSFLMRVFSPVRTRLSRSASFIARLIFFFLQDEREVTPEELRHIAKTSLKSGVLTSHEARLIDGALDLQEATVKELMRPRGEILFYNIHDPLSKLLHLFVDQQCTRVPVCDGELEHLLGILSTKHFFLHQEKVQKGEDLISILKKPTYVPEATRGWALLQNLREAGEQLAMVVDEYGSLSGLITQEDLIETVIGEISDRRDEKSLYTRSGSDVVIASGKLELGDFEDLFGVRLISRENAVTLGGWLIEQLGDIPMAGTKYATDEFLFYVLAADPNRVRRIYVRKIGSPKKKKERWRRE